MDAVDITPVANPMYAQTSTDRPHTPDPVRLLQADANTATQMRAYASRGIASTGVVTATVAELRKSAAAAISGFRNEAAVLSTEEKARNDRVVLLAKKYEGNFSREDGARLEILTQRIRRLNPRITPSAINNLSGLVDQIEEISDGIEELRRQFNF